jgi:opacity protein-like surface antigen
MALFFYHSSPTMRVLFLALLACSLASTAQALQASGPPAPKTATPPGQYVTIDLATRMAGHAAAIGFASAADLMTTSWALRQCPNCGETNPLGADVEARIALKLGYGTAALGACWLLERSNHRGWAKAVRWSAVAIFVAAAGSNTAHAIRGR